MGFITSVFNILIVFLLQFSQFFPIALFYPAQPLLPQSIPTLLSMSMGALYMFLDQTLPLLSPVILLHPPPWLLSVCSLFPCLWFYFACLFVLFTRFHLQVDHMIFVFFHLAYCRERQEFLLSFCFIVLHYVNTPLFLIHLLNGGHLGCSRTWLLVNNAAMIIGVHRFF